MEISNRRRRNMDKVINSRLLVSLSGGADSTATALILYEQGYDFELVFCDTGVEFPETYEIIYKLADITGKKLIMLGKENGSLLDNILKRLFIPSAKKRFCTGEFKLAPLRKFEKEIGKATIAIGIRFDEQERPGYRKSFGAFEKIYPLIQERYTREDTFNKCRQYGLLNSLYEWRSRVACYCCPFQRKSEWIGLLVRRPELYKKTEYVEEEVMRLRKESGCEVFTFRQGMSLRRLREEYEKQKGLW